MKLYLIKKAGFIRYKTAGTIQKQHYTGAKASVTKTTYFLQKQIKI
jgi:hypothetical protein